MTALIDRLRNPSITGEPPTQQDLNRSHWYTVAWFVFALFLGIGISNNALTNSRTVPLGEGLPSIEVPAGWIGGQAGESVVSVRNPRSPSAFNAEIRVTVRPLRAGENLVMARTGEGLRRSQELLRYRELSAEPVTVQDGSEGVLVTYAYVADPTRAAGAVAPPVVVEAQDLYFVRENQLVIVTAAADSTQWENEERNFRIVYDSLRLRYTEVNQ
jgi:hypothetical protein